MSVGVLERAEAAAGRYLLVDRLIGGYAAVITVVALTRLHVSTGNWGIALAHALILPLIWLVRRPGLGRTGRLLGEIYPIILLLGLYGALDVLQGPALPTVHDATVQGWEQALFGGQPSRDWWRAHPSAFWSTLLHAAYWGYYLIVPFPVILFALRGDRDALRRTILLEMGTFVFCYLWFVFFPVAGPYYTFARPEGAFVANPAARLVYATLAGGSSYGAAFPSSHVAATISAVVATWLGDRRWGRVLVVPALLLTVGTVYCQMHYGVDALAGLLTGVTLPTLLARLPRPAA